MKKISLTLAAAGIALLFTSSMANSELNLNIGINIPSVAVVKSLPPTVAVIPETDIYFAPDIDDDMFFYSGYWWRPIEGRWYRTVELGAPWVVIETRRVPRELISVPSDYRRVPPGHDKIPYGQMKKNWRQWEKDGR